MSTNIILGPSLIGFRPVVLFVMHIWTIKTGLHFSRCYNHVAALMTLDIENVFHSMQYPAVRRWFEKPAVGATKVKGMKRLCRWQRGARAEVGERQGKRRGGERGSGRSRQGFQKLLARREPLGDVRYGAAPPSWKLLAGRERPGHLRSEPHLFRGLKTVDSAALETQPASISKPNEVISSSRDCRNATDQRPAPAHHSR